MTLAAVLVLKDALLTGEELYVMVFLLLVSFLNVMEFQTSVFPQSGIEPKSIDSLDQEKCGFSSFTRWVSSAKHPCHSAVFARDEESGSELYYLWYGVELHLEIALLIDMKREF